MHINKLLHIELFCVKWTNECASCVPGVH